ncbi:unnamed protein product [marine sediment metagenome]|uniref:Uncharacterized protein n=1 Tax=marine sediment metagenome TaxID=412755 RepID=X1HXG3_9ZZZZ
MRFVMECVGCGNQRESPEGRDPAKLEETIELIDAMGLACRKCGEEVTMRVAGDAKG